MELADEVKQVPSFTEKWGSLSARQKEGGVMGSVHVFQREHGFLNVAPHARDALALGRGEIDREALFPTSFLGNQKLGVFKAISSDDENISSGCHA